MTDNSKNKDTEAGTNKVPEPVFTPPFRVGRKQMRAVLDEKGREVVIFPRGLESYAREYAEFLNNTRGNALKYSLKAVFTVGKKVYFTNEKLPYKVMAVSGRYAVVSRPLNRREDAELLHRQVKSGAYCTFKEAFEHNKQSPVYSLIDFEENIKAPDNLVFNAYDYSKEEQCRKVIEHLENGIVRLSNRDRCKLEVDMERSLK